MLPPRLTPGAGVSQGTVSPEEFCAVVRKLAPADYGAGSSSGAPLSDRSAPPRAQHTRGHSEPESSAAKPGSEKMAKDKPAKSHRAGFFSNSAGKAARGAEAKLYALQKMLREELIEGFEAALERLREAPDIGRQAAISHQAVCDALSTCRRLADVDPADSESAATPAEADAVELQCLRRDLATTKVALAETAAERDALEHELKALRLRTSKLKSRW